MPAQIIQFLDIYANLLVFAFIVYYFLRLRSKEKQLEKKEVKIDADYHQIVNNALTKERKIITDATSEADQIIKSATYVSTASQKVLEDALHKMMLDVHTQATDSARSYITNYQKALHQLATSSLTDFQAIVKAVEVDMQHQTKTFRDAYLPALNKQLEEYKIIRMKETEQQITRIVQQVSQELLNKSISLDDHHTLLVQSLEKAKKEGFFD